MDRISAIAAIELQLHDLKDLEASGHADQHVLAMQRRELETAATILRDSSMAASLAKACQQDAAMLPYNASSPRPGSADHARLSAYNEPAVISVPNPDPIAEDLGDRIKRRKRAVMDAFWQSDPFGTSTKRHRLGGDNTQIVARQHGQKRGLALDAEVSVQKRIKDDVFDSFDDTFRPHRRYSSTSDPNHAPSQSD